MSQLVTTLHGLGVALVTPFHPDGKVDFPALQRLVNIKSKATQIF